MRCYIIRFVEKSTRKRGSIASDSDTREIEDIEDENKVRHAIAESFALAVNILNNGITEINSVKNPGFNFSTAHLTSTC